MLAEVETGFGVGSSTGFPFIIEYALDVFEELRQAAEDAFHSIPYGGVEIGAVLLGEYEERLVRVKEWRPISCIHLNGPSFVLSQADLARLEKQLEDLREAPELRGLVPVGWFHTRTRTRLALTPRALEVFNKYFPGPLQVTMVMRPSKAGPTMAGFFYRDVDGSVHTDFSYHEFPALPNSDAPGMPRRPTAASTANAPLSREPVRAMSKNQGRSSEVSSEEAPLDPRLVLFKSIEASQDETEQAPQGELSTPMSSIWLAGETPTPIYRRRPVIAFAGVLLLTSAGLAYQFTRPPSPPPSLALHAERGAGEEILVCWDAKGDWVRQARSGRLLIVDGALRRELNLDGSDLRSGSITYVRHTSEVEFVLSISDAKQERIKEYSRFIGPPLQGSEAASQRGDPKQMRGQLRQEVERTRKALQSETARTDELEEALRTTASPQQ